MSTQVTGTLVAYVLSRNDPSYSTTICHFLTGSQVLRRQVLQSHFGTFPGEDFGVGETRDGFKILGELPVKQVVVSI